MKEIKKNNLRGISEILSEKELKNVVGGYTCDCTLPSGFRGVYVVTSGGRQCSNFTCS
jgi:natural product precursor